MREAIRDFSMIEPNDGILIGLSGGKDSLALVEFLSKWCKAIRVDVKLHALHVMVKGVEYQSDERYLLDFCNKHDVAYHTRQISYENDRQERRTPCFLCSWNRRKALFEVAQALGCNKIALGHHQDDILHTALMNLSFNGSFATMPARLKMRKMPLSIIRPLCNVPETMIKAWAQQEDYSPVVKVCPHDTASHRHEAAQLMTTLEHFSTDVRANLWHALLKDGKLEQED